MARKDLVARIGRLAKAVAVSDRKGDDPGVEKWSVRLADASSSLAVLVNPGLAEEEEELAAVAGPFDGPPIDPAYFVSSEGGDEVYIAGREGGLPGEGVDWTKFAVEFQRRDDLTAAPRDFNPLDLPVKA